MKIPKRLMRHQVTIRRVVGEGSTGPILGDPETVRAHVEDGVTRVITGVDGQQETSTGLVILDPGLPPGPRSTIITPTREAIVLAVEVKDHPDAPSHLVVRIQ
ncbi:hypothetical protein [Mycetocola saprophilus]|uniref:hypothetical protein n=1 Tax=Mycetocola saprophilus TaxID=76636 RepID=UPI0004C0DBCA|nr:hypothetical protein [Mycetocola saprophilus]